MSQDPDSIKEDVQDPFLLSVQKDELGLPPPDHLPADHQLDPDLSCGFGPFKPEWMQRFASKKAFIAVFSLLSVIQGMTWSYFTATITTIEKRFKISSQTTGIVMTGNEMSQILFSILLAYYGGRGHRPRWIAAGVLFSAMSCLLLASPHFFYGPGNDALALTTEYEQRFATPNRATTTPFPNVLDSQSTENVMNSSDLFMETTTKAAAKGSRRSRIQICDKNAGPPRSDCEASDKSIVPLVLIFISQFVSGIGVLLFFSLGGPYLDDNMKKEQSPMMFGILMSLRLVGPTFGFLFAGKCLQIYISPSLTPTIAGDDPRWMGAWWLGWVALGCFMAFTSVLIAMFPRELPRAALRKKLATDMSATEKLSRAGSQLVFTAEAANANPIPKFSDMVKAMKALLTNKINMYNNFSGVFYIFSAIGYWSYMPKYMETIFRQTAVSAAVVSGIVSIAFQSCGLLLSGYLISKWKPSARKLAGWNVFIGFLYVIVKASFTQMGCEQGTLASGSKYEDGSFNLTDSCNADCYCQVNKMQPVCYTSENKMFYSACHAGCQLNSNATISQCACLPSMDEVVKLGPCSDTCFNMFILFLAVNAFIKFLDSSGRIGNMLVSYRCVDPKDKSLAIGFSIFLVSFLAMLPSPILFGRIIDSACTVWGDKCGKRGNCWIYEPETLRYAFNMTAAAFTCLGAVFDVLVWIYVKDLDLYDEEKNTLNRIESEKRKSQR